MRGIFFCFNVFLDNDVGKNLKKKKKKNQLRLTNHKCILVGRITKIAYPWLQLFFQGREITRISRISAQVTKNRSFMRKFNGKGRLTKRNLIRVSQRRSFKEEKLCNVWNVHYSIIHSEFLMHNQTLYNLIAVMVKCINYFII